MDQAAADKKFEAALAELPPLRQKFVREYLADPELNGREAYRKAYPDIADSTAHPAASRLLRHDRKVAAAVQAGMNARGLRLQITADNVLQELATLAFANMADYTTTQADGSVVVDLTNATREQMAAIAEIVTEEYLDGKGPGAREVKRTKIKLYNRDQNLERLGKHLKLFTDVVEHKGLDELADRIRRAREKAGDDLIS